MEIYLQVCGILWWARPDVDNPGPMPCGGAPWEVGYFDEGGARVAGDWLTEAEARAELADIRLDDERRAEDEYERRFYRD